jgi:RNA polymerase sigma-B factor
MTHHEQNRSGTRRSDGHREKRERARQSRLFAQLYDTGERAAFDQLVECFGPLARSLARRYNNTSEPYEDLCQVAQLGLIKAIQQFDPDRGFPFQAYAIPTILGELRRYFRNSSWSVHVPRGVQERALEVRDTERALNEEHGRSPTVPELAQFMELSVEQVLEAMHALRSYGSVSLDAPRANDSHDEDGSYAETIGEEDGRFDLVELGASLSPALAMLEPDQRELLRMRYIEEMTQSQIAQRIGVSQMQVSRLLQRCLAELRDLAGVSPIED